MGLVLALSPSAYCRNTPRPCISARSPADYCAFHSAQLFQPAEVSASQAPNPNAMPRRHASPVPRGSWSASPRSYRVPPHGGANTSIALSSEHHRIR